MKKTKIIAITIAILTLLTFLTISASAEEIDYNKVIAIGTDGDYEYYSTTAVGNSATWKNFIDYYKAHDESFPFAWIGDYVLYKEEILRDGGLKWRLLKKRQFERLPNGLSKSRI